MTVWTRDVPSERVVCPDQIGLVRNQMTGEGTGVGPERTNVPSEPPETSGCGIEDTDT